MPTKWLHTLLYISFDRDLDLVGTDQHLLHRSNNSLTQSHPYQLAMNWSSWQYTYTLFHFIIILLHYNYKWPSLIALLTCKQLTKTFGSKCQQLCIAQQVEFWYRSVSTQLWVSTAASLTYTSQMLCRATSKYHITHSAYHIHNIMSTGF